MIWVGCYRNSTAETTWSKGGWAFWGPGKCGGDSTKWVLAPNRPLSLPWVTTSRDGAQVINCSYSGSWRQLWNRGIISMHMSQDRGWWLTTYQSLLQRLSHPLRKEYALSPQLIGSHHLSSHFDQQLRWKKPTRFTSEQLRCRQIFPTANLPPWAD